MEVWRVLLSEKSFRALAIRERECRLVEKDAGIKGSRLSARYEGARAGENAPRDPKGRSMTGMVPPGIGWWSSRQFCPALPDTPEAGINAPGDRGSSSTH